MEIKKFKKGDVIIEEGSRGTCAYIIESGKVEVSRTYRYVKKVLTTLEEKQVFGEMGLIEDKPRSATVTAVEDSILSVISRESFNDLFGKNPNVILSILKPLFERLRSATATLVKDSVKYSTKSFKRQDKKHSIIIKDNRYIVISGLNEISKKILAGEELVVMKFPFKAGRKGKEEDIFSDNDLQIKEDVEPYYVSKNHFLIDKIEGHFVVIDRGSHSGLIINGTKIKGAYIFQMNENTITVGSSYSPFEFKLVIKGDVESVSLDDTSDKPNDISEGRSSYFQIIKDT